jgi:hypothetical protein
MDLKDRLMKIVTPESDPRVKIKARSTARLAYSYGSWTLLSFVRCLITLTATNAVVDL